MALSALLIYWVLPFVLVFVLVFAILHKSKIFGDDKEQINALVALVIAALFVIVPGPHVEYVVSMIPWLSVALICILIFFLLYGFIAGELKEVPDWMKKGGLVLAIVFIVVLVVMITPLDDLIKNYMTGNGDWLINLVILGLTVGAVYWAVKPSGK